MITNKPTINHLAAALEYIECEFSPGLWAQLDRGTLNLAQLAEGLNEATTLCTGDSLEQKELIATTENALEQIPDEDWIFVASLRSMTEAELAAMHVRARQEAESFEAEESPKAA